MKLFSAMSWRLPGTAAFCILAAAGCDRGGAPVERPATAWTLTDTMPWANLVSEGRYALLRRDDVVIDSVDLAFGVQVVGHDSVLFLPVRPDTSPEGMVRNITDHVLYDGHTTTLLRDIVPHFNSLFSSPAVIDGALLYWGLQHENGVDSVKAIRYEFRRRRLNIQPLTDSIVGTDDRFYFTPPHLEGKEIVFKSPSGRWAFRVPRASQ